eukprot:Skav219537  [mRNA]  locus=scaffold30:835276:840171:- [translate_table: standard]
MRVGEAAHPGPILGTANTCGLSGKGESIAMLPDGVWGLTETHLTQAGAQRMRMELKCADPSLNFVAGAPAASLSDNMSSIGGKASGVAVVSRNPIRPLAGQFDMEAWSTARIQTVAAYCGTDWLKVGVMYGFAHKPKSVATREASDDLLASLVDRLAFNQYGYRAIIGDFNQTSDSLPQFEVLRKQGWVEIQEYGKAKWNRDIVPTCKRTTTVDQMWLSPELQPLLEDIVVDDTYYPDHGILYGSFKDFGRPPPFYIWPKPYKLPWGQLTVDQLLQTNREMEEERATDNQADIIPAIFQELEHRVDMSLRASGKPGLLAQQKGRSTTIAPKLCRNPITPLKPSRPSEVQVTFLGEHFQHQLWCRQLRRLQSMVHVMKSTKQGSQVEQHRRDLWESIKAAKGFPGGFKTMWLHRTHRLHGSPSRIPKHPPPLTDVEHIFQGFHFEFQRLEKMLNSARQQKARTRRLVDKNVIYRDIGQPKSLPIQTLVTKQCVEVTEVSADGLTVELARPEFTDDMPVHSQDGLLHIESVRGTQVQFAAPTSLEVGSIIMQEKHIGDYESLYREFKALWNPMWNKHEGLPVDHWDEVILRIAQHMPQSDTIMPLAPITVDEWIATVKSKKPHSAVGPDGIGRDDLLNLPPDLTEALVREVNCIEAGHSSWHPSNLVGLITSIEKHSAACTPAQYRPITVLSFLYRTWSSIRTKQCLQWLQHRAPEGLLGNRPGHDTSGIWFDLMLQVEDALYADLPITGVVTDVCKAFNTLPRAIVLCIAKLQGLPTTLISSWHDSVTKISRAFVINGTVSQPVFACTGYPEGDPMSIIAMWLINCALHVLIPATTGPTTILSYVDNWEVHVETAEEAIEAFQAMVEFSRDIDIKLDVPKTWFWALHPTERANLRNRGYQVKLAERDLGGHLQLCRQVTNFTVRNRIKSLGLLWTWLSRSPAPTIQKLHCLGAVAWPKAFHGVSTTQIGECHFDSLRAHAMSSLRWNKKGASSLIQFGMITGPIADLAFYVVWDTIAKFRTHANPDCAFPLLDKLISSPPSRYLPGPCGTLLTRMQMLLWQWEGNGFIIDHEGLRFHIADSPIQFLRYRAEHAWGIHIGSIMSSRQEFAGLQHVDVRTSRCGLPGRSVEEQGLLRVIMNGTFCTRNKQIHGGKVADKLCPWCGHEDSVEHRHWECDHFEDIRAKVPVNILQDIQASPDCTRLHGWCVQGPEDIQFRQSLMTIRDTTHEFLPVPPCGPILHMFTDGSCLEPQTPQLRLATWGVVLGNLDHRTFHPLSMGGVHGGYHTVLRAEILAAISSCRYAIATGRTFCIWTDNKLVFDFMRRCQFFPDKVQLFSRKRKDHDLWNVLGILCHQCIGSNLLLHVIKVSSHQRIFHDTPEVERWAFEGNEQADRLAITARDHLPPQVLLAWTRYANAYRQRCSMQSWLHRVFVEVGQRALTAKAAQQLADADENQRQIHVASHEFEQHSISLVELPRVPSYSNHSMGECHEQVFHWLRMLTTHPDATPVWVSSFQLLGIFQQQTSYLGVKYVARLKGYIWLHAPDDHDTHGFVRIAAWLMALIKCLARHYGTTCTTKDHIPWGCAFKVWARCILMPIPTALLAALDRLLYGRGVAPITQLTAQLGTLMHFIDT